MIATLPPNVTPDRTVYTVVTTGTDTYADLAIEPTGQIVASPPRPRIFEDLSGLSLDGVTYQPRQPPRPVPHALSLTRRGDVVVLLRKPRSLELVVFKLGAHAYPLGSVALRRTPAGWSRRAWRLRLRERRLRPGDLPR